MSIKWGLSVLDWRDHAINESQDHPIGVLKAECGHLLMLVTPLRETSCGTKYERAHSQSPGTPSERPAGGESPPWITERMQMTSSRRAQGQVRPLRHATKPRSRGGASTVN